MDETIIEKLEEERDHSAFLERLLKALYGDGWDRLTIADAKNVIVIKPT
jgi:hypothetical protein